MATAATKRRAIKRRGLVRRDRRPSYANANDVSWTSSGLCNWNGSRSERLGERREEDIQNANARARNKGVEQQAQGQRKGRGILKMPAQADVQNKAPH